jgi:hypothetical protein
VLSGKNVHYETSDKAKVITHGGLGLIIRLISKLALAERLDESLCTCRSSTSLTTSQIMC